MSQFSKVVVTPGPHIKNPEGTTTIMADVIIALIPALVMSIITFGFRALVVTLTCVIACVLSEAIFNKISRKDLSITDLSAVVTGILLAFNLPVTIPLWIAVIGCVVAIIVAKMIFGGIGQNFVNPALGGRAFLVLSWTAAMTTWTIPGQSLSLFGDNVDALTSATPMVQLQAGTMPNASLFDMFIGQTGGCLGETSALMLLAGFCYLLYRKVVAPTIPVAYLGTVFVLAYLFPAGNDPLTFALAHILGGGVMLGALFMATDYTTSPVTRKGQIIFGIGCGLLTIFIRFFASAVEGVTFSILIMNALVFLIDKYTFPKRFGAPKKVKAVKEAK